MACGKNVTWYAMDTSDEESIKALMAATVKDVEQMDILVNSRSLNKGFPAEGSDMDVFQRILSVNVADVIICCKHSGKQMMEYDCDKVINVFSVRGKIATWAPGNAAHCDTRGVMDMVARQLAAGFGPHGITVNVIAPTVVETSMMITVTRRRGGDACRRQQADTLPMRCIAVPQDYVDLAASLTSHTPDLMTGNIIYPDDGLAAVG